MDTCHLKRQRSKVIQSRLKCLETRIILNNSKISWCKILYSGLLIFRGKKKQNFAGFSRANSRKNRPISRDFRGKKVKIRGAIGRFQAIFAREKSKFAEKSAHFAGFQRKKVKFRRIFRGKFLEKSADFTGNFGGKLRQETISKKQPISLDFFGKFR